MSITSLRKMFENKGCQALLILIGALSMIGLLIPGSCQALLRNQSNQAADMSPPVLQLGNIKMSEAQFSEVFTASVGQMGASLANEPDFRLNILAQSARTLAQQAAVKSLVDDKKVNLDDKAILNFVETRTKELIEQQKDVLKATGKIKPGATAAEADAILKEELKQDPADILKSQLEQVKANLADPRKRAQLEGAAGIQVLLDAEKPKFQITDDELRKDYESFVLDQVPFQDNAVPQEKRKELAEKALADAKAGKSIDEIRKTYSPAGTTAPVTMTRAMLATNDDTKPVMGLKVGEWSPVIVTMGFPVIYRVAKIESSLPKDFEENKEKYRRSHVETLATKAVNDAVEAKVSTAKWLSAGLDLVVRYQKATTDKAIISDPVKRKELLTKMNEEARSVDDKTRSGDEAAALVRNATSKQLYGLATPDEQKTLVKERKDALSKIMQFVDSVTLRLEMVDLSLKTDEPEAAGENLLEASRLLGRPDATTEANYATISKKLDELKATKKVPEATLTKTDDELKRWIKDKIEFDKDQAELKKQQEETAKTLKAEEDKAKAEKAAAEKNKPKDAAPKADAGKPTSPADQFLNPGGTKGG